MSLEYLTKGLADEGRLMEAGWISLQLVAMAPDATMDEVWAMRMSFMAGAAHLFSSIVTMLGPGGQIGLDDCQRLDMVANELKIFSEDLGRRLKSRRCPL